MADTRGTCGSGSTRTGFCAGSMLSPVGLTFGFAGRERGKAHFTPSTMEFMRWIALLACIGPVFSQAGAQESIQPLDVSAKQAWVDTGLDLRPGDVLSIRASGTLTIPSGKDKSGKPVTASVTADGAKRGFRDLIKAYPVNEAGQGALIGRIGSSDAATPFLVGASKSWTSPRAGRLFLGINTASNDARSEE